MQRFRRALPVLAVCAVGACATPPPASGSLVALTPTEQFQVEVRSTPDEILLAPHGRLSPAQESALADLAERWRDAGEGPIVIHAQSGPAKRTARAAAHALHMAGVPGEFVRTEDAAAAEGAAAPVRVGYSRLVAVGPQCANIWGNLTHTAANTAHSTFGCAVTANLAVQTADPRDLIAPRTSYPADAVRRAVVLGKYRKGEKTSSERDDDERGDVSAAKK